MANRRVVVTGLGAVTPLGNTVPDSWQAVINGASGVGQITRFDPSRLVTKIAAEVKNFDSSQVVSVKEARKIDVFVQFALEASRQALDDAGLEITDAMAPRVGAAIGSGIGGLIWIERHYDMLRESGPRRVSPFFIPGAIINMAAGMVAMKFNLQGPNISIVTACTTGTHNIGQAMRMVQYGDADIMLAGGTEMTTDELCIAGFSSARALSKRNDEPQKASRPWDKDRDGFVLGEGAGILVLEEYEHAKARGAKIYAEAVGFGMSDDAYHFTAPQPEGNGFVLAMQNTIKDAGVDPTEVDYINAHGTSTPAADHIEALAIKRSLGDHAYDMAVSSTKSMTGHMLGAAGAVEAIFAVLAIQNSIAPPTINLDNPGEGCDLNFVAHQAQEREINVALSNSFGFGGTNGCIAFKKL